MAKGKQDGEPMHQSVNGEPIMVRATAGGTYPDPGESRARWRNVGDIFALSEARHFSNKWMAKVTAQEVAAYVPPTKPIPQTTGAHVRRPDPFQLIQ